MPNATILVIEDNRDILDAIRLLLEQGGYNVITVGDCTTAYDYLAQHSPDLIVTDLMIPDITGLEFIHQVRRVSNYDRVPIIAMSAYDRTYLAAAVGAGAITGLHKPEDLDILVRTINQVLAKNYKGEVAQAG